ncbi:CIA30 family protein [Cellvibrio sp. QJXJ]|uniref:CIA30 family protein n=1 Tax=Cellvibrio sp. QJXJ TaxID=2964606 RepID=UPI0021C336A6|nr:CIA30 family protein [Cellvibrio sp. QJXJ]UUA71190.1 CIA30 family protein [Cellvibrio sp. QJXJ]
MKHLFVKHLFIRYLGLAAILTLSSASFGGGLSPLIDDFSDASNNNLGIPRQFLNDTLAGGNTTTAQAVVQGIINAKGEIIPPRGQPGWASMILPLDSQSLPKDASAFEGVRLLIKINSGSMSISANSTEITNFDYHAAPITVMADGKFHEVKIPFAAMKRAWSEQTPLNTKTINSLSIVAFGLQKSAFDFAVDEVSFY